MIDVKKLARDVHFKKYYIASRMKGNDKIVEEIIQTYNTHLVLQKNLHALLHKKNTLSKDYKTSDRDTLLDLKHKIKQLEQDMYTSRLLMKKAEFLPNAPSLDVVHKENQIIKSWGECIPRFWKKNHKNIYNIDFVSGSKISQVNFTVLKGIMSSLHRAIGQFMLDTHIYVHQYTELYVPYLVNAKSMFNSGQLPKFEDEMFKTHDELYLIPTSEVPITNMIANETFYTHQLPFKYVTLSPCFRREAGSYGKSTSGLIRQHQFDKVELYQVVHPEQSDTALHQILQHAEYVLQELKVPYRVVLLGLDDLGFCACKTYDIEAYFSSEDKYIEVSSCSNCSDFQARRLRTRIQSPHGTSMYPHTLNGSGLAVGRTLLAVLDNYQTEDGYIDIPIVLRKYLGGLHRFSIN